MRARAGPACAGVPPIPPAPAANHPDCAGVLPTGLAWVTVGAGGAAVWDTIGSIRSQPDAHERSSASAAANGNRLLLALVVHRRPPTAHDNKTEHERSKARTQALLERLSRLRVLTTVVAGFLLGIGGPKRLVLTSLAATTIVTAGLGDGNQAALVVVYVTLATVLVWVPLILFLLLRKRVITRMESAEGEVSRRQPQVTVYALVLLAALLVLDAVSVLLT